MQDTIYGFSLHQIYYLESLLTSPVTKRELKLPKYSQSTVLETTPEVSGCHVDHTLIEQLISLSSLNNPSLPLKAYSVLSFIAREESS